MHELSIRQMTADDYDIFCKFYGDLHSIHFKERPDIFRERVALMPREIFAEDMAKPERAAFIAEIDGEAAGMCMVSVHAVADDANSPLVPHTMLHIDDIYTAEKFRRQGVATALYKTAEKFAVDCGVEKLQLNVWGFNKAAMALYEKLGMKPMFIKMEKML